MLHHSYMIAGINPFYDIKIDLCIIWYHDIFIYWKRIYIFIPRTTITRCNLHWLHACMLYWRHLTNVGGRSIVAIYARPWNTLPGNAIVRGPTRLQPRLSLAARNICSRPICVHLTQDAIRGILSMDRLGPQSFWNMQSVKITRQ